MQLNGIELSTYSEKANECTFLLDCSLGAALSLDGQTLTVTSGERPVAIFSGYSVASVSVQGEYTAMRCVRKLDDATAAAIEGLDANVKNLESRTTDSEAAINALLTGEVM
ncbi:MAG: hypothetical protein IJW29_06180 [Clostridia bacterium]|nr:hypothetical protein [Clostridia bacterium]